MTVKSEFLKRIKLAVVWGSRCDQVCVSFIANLLDHGWDKAMEVIHTAKAKGNLINEREHELLIQLADIRREMAESDKS